jgi:pimeloyl-ACP methyl ester carboxylesterase
MGFLLSLGCGMLLPLAWATAAGPATRQVRFTTHDGLEMQGKLTLPPSAAPHAVVVYVQTAEGMTVDMKRPKGGGATFNYLDLYRTRLPAMDVAFFSYEGRGVRMGDAPPRYEAIDRQVYNTSTLDNKVRDVLAAVRALQKEEGIDPARIFLIGSSEGTLLAAEAASRAPKEIAGLVLYAVMSANMREIFRYIMSDGGYLVYLGYFDTNKDGRISKAEFEADPKKYRERVFAGAPFEPFDRNADGFFTADEMKLLTARYLEAIDSDDFDVLDRWARTAAGVSTPDGWFKDHFAHPAIWTFLERLEMPVGLFHGVMDASAPVAGVRELEDRAKRAGKSNLEFHYFETLDHSLGLGPYLVGGGTLPDGHKSIFEFIARQIRR